MTDEPTLGELSRLIANLTQQVTLLATQIGADRIAADDKFLPRQWWAEMHRADQAVVSDLAADIRGCREASIAEVRRVETALEKFNDEYDEDRKANQRRREVDEETRKGRNLQVALFAIGLVVAQLVSIGLGVLAVMSK